MWQIFGPKYERKLVKVIKANSPKGLVTHVACSAFAGIANSGASVSFICPTRINSKCSLFTSWPKEHITWKFGLFYGESIKNCMPQFSSLIPSIFHHLPSFTRHDCSSTRAWSCLGSFPWVAKCITTLRSDWMVWAHVLHRLLFLFTSLRIFES